MRSFKFEKLQVFSLKEIVKKSKKKKKEKKRKKDSVKLPLIESFNWTYVCNLKGYLSYCT